MAVHNGADFVREAVDSLLAQTDPHFEIVVIDDGSTDSTPDILASYRDPRLAVERIEHLGQAAALAAGVSRSRGVLIAVLDADDIALPHRLAAQRTFLAEHRDVALVGSAAIEFDHQGERIRRTVSGPAAVRRSLAMFNVFYHSSIMFRRQAYDSIGGYRPDSKWGMDFELYVRMASRYQIDIMPEALIRHRQHSEQWSRQRYGKRFRWRRAAANQLWAARELNLSPFLWPFTIGWWIYARLPKWVFPARAKSALRRLALKAAETFGDRG